MDGCKIGDPSFYDTKVDITHVDSPSSMMYRCMTKFQMDIRIWKAIVEGIWGSPLSVSNVINLEAEGSIAPREASKAFRYIQKVLSTSRSNMAIGVWSKSSTML